MANQRQYGPIATLGPKGTDSVHLASSLTQEVICCESFPAALEFAYQNDIGAIICCGYTKKSHGTIVDTWVDLNFRYLNKMKITQILCSPTKPMGVAVRDKTEKVRSLVIHPSTEVFTEELEFDEIQYVNNKPTAVKLVAEGTYDMCIGSLDVIDQYSNLKVIKQMSPQMVWALYYRSDLYGEDDHFENIK